MISRGLKDTLSNVFNSKKRVTILTGAGVSAESGIPTFRGPEGYWTVGSRNYQPQEIGTYDMFLRNPQEVWKWFLFRRGVCRSANPNPGHLAIAEMEELLRDRFTLITQNVDGLHIRAGNSPERTYQVHGNLDYMRCGKVCSMSIYPLPDETPVKKRGEGISKAEWELLRCPECGGITRPHVLLWDEYYNEEFYRFESSLQIAEETDLLIAVGTTGATNLPNQVVSQVLLHGGIIIDINIQRNRFSEMALENNRGYFLQHPSSLTLPSIVDFIRKLKNN
jgi:NAD-dependent deacetylase